MNKPTVFGRLAENIGQIGQINKDEERKLFAKYIKLKRKLIKEVFKDPIISRHLYDDITHKRFYAVFHYNVKYFRHRCKKSRKKFNKVIQKIKNVILDYVNGNIDYDKYVRFLRTLTFIKLDYLSKIIKNYNIQTSVFNEIISIRNKITENNLKLVLFVVNNMLNKWEKTYRDDAIQEGVLGLMNAVDRYDPSRGEFSTYATNWIRCYVQAYLKTVDIVQITESMRRTYRTVLKLYVEDPNITPEEIEAITEIPHEDVISALTTMTAIDIDNIEIPVEPEVTIEEEIDFIGGIEAFLNKQPPLIRDVLLNLLKYENVLSRIEMAQIHNVNERYYLNLLIFIMSKLLEIQHDVTVN